MNHRRHSVLVVDDVDIGFARDHILLLLHHRELVRHSHHLWDRVVGLDDGHDEMGEDRSLVDCRNSCR